MSRNEEYEELMDMPPTELCDYVFQLRGTIEHLKKELAKALGERVKKNEYQSNE